MDEIWNLSYFRQYKPTVQISLNYKIWARQRFVDFGWIDPRVNLHLQVDSTIVRYIDAKLLHKGIWKTFLYLSELIRQTTWTFLDYFNYTKHVVKQFKKKTWQMNQRCWNFSLFWHIMASSSPSALAPSWSSSGSIRSSASKSGLLPERGPMSSTTVQIGSVGKKSKCSYFRRTISNARK